MRGGMCPDFRRARCLSCGKRRSDGANISWNGLCEECGLRNFTANLDQLRAHDGPYFQRHRRACVAAFGGVLLDDVRAET